MSQGPGTIQRYILREVSRRKLVPVIVLASLYAREMRVGDTPHLRASFRRAAGRLTGDGQLRGWDVLLPTRQFADRTFGSLRKVFCVAPSGCPQDLTEDMLHDAFLAMALFAGQ